MVHESPKPLAIPRLARKYKLAKATFGQCHHLCCHDVVEHMKSTAHLSVYIAWCSELIMTSKYLDVSCDYLQLLQKKLCIVYCSYLPFLLCCPFVVVVLLGGPMNYHLVKAFSS